MSNTINTDLSAGFTEFTFSDTNSGEVFAQFRMNPADARIIRRMKNVGEFFSELAQSKPPVTLDEILEYEDAVESKFCQFLGYDCREELFHRVAATDTMPDGRLFASHVLDVIIRNIGPEMQRRRRENVARYTSKYTAEAAK